MRRRFAAVLVFIVYRAVYRKETLPRPQSLAITGVPQSPLSLGKACGGGRRKPISVVVYLPNRSRELVFSTDPVAPAPRTPHPGPVLSTKPDEDEMCGECVETFVKEIIAAEEILSLSRNAML